MNFYDILEVPHDANSEVIRKSYRRLATLYHPDKNKNKEVDTTRQFTEIKAAYEVLSDPVKRKEYDLMNTDQKLALYDTIKDYFSTVSPKFKNAVDKLINEFYSDEEELRSDINSFNFSKLYNRFRETILNKDPLGIMSFDSISFDEHEPVKRDIYEHIKVTLDDRYKNRKKKITVQYPNNKSESFIIPCLNSEAVFKGKGENGGNLIINILCEEHPKFEQLNQYNVIYTAPISIYEYFYGGEIQFDYLGGDTITFKFGCGLGQKNIFCIANKGLPNGDKRGDLYVFLEIEGINYNKNSLMFDKYSNTVRGLLSDLFPPLNKSNSKLNE